MPVCKNCGEEADELVTVNLHGKRRKLCEECADEVQHDADMAEESEAAVQQMMGFTGRR
jgi:phosphoribosyl-ATP pyrophosphohydrolase